MTNEEYINVIWLFGGVFIGSFLTNLYYFVRDSVRDGNNRNRIKRFRSIMKNCGDIDLIRMIDLVNKQKEMILKTNK